MRQVLKTAKSWKPRTLVSGSATELLNNGKFGGMHKYLNIIISIILPISTALADEAADIEEFNALFSEYSSRFKY